MVAKSVLGLLDLGESAGHDRRGGRPSSPHENRGGGLELWPDRADRHGQRRSTDLDEGDRALALAQAIAFLADDVGRPRPPVRRSTRWTGPRWGSGRLSDWYRRFVDTRSGDAAERALATALASGDSAGDVSSGAFTDVEAMLFAAVTDHVFIDEGHTIDFTNKAFELIGSPRPRARLRCCCRRWSTRRPGPPATRSCPSGATPTTWRPWSSAPP